MKRALLVLALAALVLSCASAQTVLYKSQATLAWDAVTVDSAGAPLLPTDVVAYEVYVYDYTVGVADVQNVSLLTFVAATSATEQLIVFPYRTTWAAGVRVRLVDGGGALSYSALAWSYVVADAGVAGPFCYSPKGLPKKPGALRDAGM
jgi:hypothetical protein